MSARHLVLLWALLASLLALPVRAQEQGGRVALVIGNGNYAEADPALSAATGDAKLIAEEFRRFNFDVDLKENLGVSDMKRAVDAFIGKLRDGSTALFYFSGYGVQAGGQTYLVPVGAQITSEDSARQEGISLDTVLADMHRRKAKVKIVIVDAARQSPYETKFRRNPAGLSAIKSPEGTLAIYSSALGKLVPRVAGTPSVFARELVRELKIQNRGLEDIFASTKGAVSRATNYEQVPWTTTSLYDQLYLDQATPTPTAVTQAQKQTPPTAETKAPAPTTTPPSTTTTAAATPSTTTATPAPSTTTTTAAAPATSSSSSATSSSSTSSASTTSSGATTPSSSSSSPSTATKQAAIPPQPAVVQVDDVSDPAIRDLEARIKKNPKDIAAYYRRGQIYAFNKAYRRAIADFGTVLKSNPKDPEALNNRCWIRAVIGELQDALRDCDAAIANRDRYGDAYDSRGFVHLKLGQNSEAIANYDAALRINTRHASAFYGRGLARIRAGNQYAGDSDIAAAKALQANIVEEFASYGVR
jgi:Tfp pilus assembly protein PilF